MDEQADGQDVPCIEVINDGPRRLLTVAEYWAAVEAARDLTPKERRQRDIAWAYYAYTPERLTEDWLYSKEAEMRICDRDAYDFQMKQALGLL